MRAVVFRAVGDIRLEDVEEPAIQEPTDAIIRVTASAICGTDLHMIRGTMPGMKPGTILGHEAVGVVEEVGSGLRNLRKGDRVVVPSTIACGSCSYCRAGWYAQCDGANPHGKLAGTAFFGGPESSGPFHGLQAEWARVPFAHVGPVRLPEGITDDQAILLSDIFPTAWFGADMAGIKAGDTVAVFGCGPVGQFVIASAKMMSAGRVLAVDQIPARLEMARAQGAEVVDYRREDPVSVIRELTGGIGVDRAIDAVGVDSERPHGGPVKVSRDEGSRFDREVAEVTGGPAEPKREHWRPGDGPSQALQWAVEALAKGGTLSIIGVYPPTMRSFPIGAAMNKNLRIHAGNCHHRRYLPRLVELVATGAVDPRSILTQVEPLTDVMEAYVAFDERRAGWIKVELKP